MNNRVLEQAYVSTGRLPPTGLVKELVEAAYERFRNNAEGENSQVYPALASVPPNLFGICVAGTNGAVYAVGDTNHEFSIMSVSKPFLFALICELIGAEEARARLGANATGFAFNSIAGIERTPDGRTNPMVNAGAIATTSLVPGATHAAKWQFIHEGLSVRRPHAADEPGGSRVRTGNQLPQSQHRAIPAKRRHDLLRPHGSGRSLHPAMFAQRQRQGPCRHGCTLADGGVNPVTKERVVDPMVCHYALAVMTTAGLYETSGDWLFDIGLPGKSGIGGGIVTVSPGKGGLGTFAPPLDAAGNSVKGQLVAKFLSQRLGLDLFVSQPER